MSSGFEERLKKPLNWEVSRQDKVALGRPKVTQNTPLSIISLRAALIYLFIYPVKHLLTRLSISPYCLPLRPESPLRPAQTGPAADAQARHSDALTLHAEKAPAAEGHRGQEISKPTKQIFPEIS